jgi:hypothetical protein
MGVTGAIMTGKLTKPWTDLTKIISGDMKKIGMPLVGPLTTFLGAVGKITNKMTPTFVAAMNAIGPALGNFLDAIVAAFGQKSVQASIIAVANAFGKILNAITPSIAGDMTMIANSITSLANTIAKNPQAMADVFQYIVNIVNFLISAVDKLAGAATAIERWHGGVIPKAIGATAAATVAATAGTVNVGKDLLNLIAPPVLAPVATSVTSPRSFAPQQRFLYSAPAAPGPARVQTGPIPGINVPGANPQAAANVMHDINKILSGPGGGETFSTWFSHYFDDVRHSFASLGSWIGHAGATIWQGTWLGLTAARHNVASHFDEIRHDVSGWFDSARGWIATEAKAMIGGMMTGLGIGWRDVKNFFTVTVPQNITNWFNTASTWLIVHGEGIINGLTTGIGIGWRDIHNFFTVVVPSNVKGWFIDAASWLINAGEDIVSGLYHGIVMIFVDVKSWVAQNVYTPLLHAVEDAFGIPHGSAAKMLPVGKEIITGIIHGMIAEGKHLDKFVGEIFGSWPKALMAFIGKGAIDVAKLPSKVLHSLMGAAGAVGSFFSGILGIGSSAGVSAAGAFANGLQLYKYLRQNLFGGNKIAAAGAAASIWGESGWNPFAVGTGGRGLIGWTPEGTISNAAFAGGMKTQLPEILQFVKNAGDFPAILAMMGSKTVSAAANIWGKRVERYGINDVHAQGIALASQFLKYDSGGWLPPGVTVAYNMTGKHERVMTQEQLASGVAGAQYHAHFDGLTGAAIESHVRTAFQVMSITEGNLQRQGRRS